MNDLSPASTESVLKQLLQWSFPLRINTLFLLLLLTGATMTVVALVDANDLWAGAVADIEEAPGYEDPQDTERKWALSIGLQGGFSPDYEGSNDYKFSPGPNISASWRDLIFYKGKTLGANLVRQKKLKAGPLLSWTSGRSEDDNEKLEGLGDVDDSLEAGGFIAYRKKPWRFRAEVRQDVGSGHEGALVAVNAGTAMPFENPLVLVELGLTWASADYMESFFGIDAQQAANSGLQSYSADAGVKDFNLRMTGGYAITRRWRLGGAIEYKRLVGDASDSPIVDEANQFFAGFGLSYHMGSKILPEDLQ
jgi:outer membrane scaffolding protein for murein synthesis (MipA/OmpV family)